MSAAGSQAERRDGAMRRGGANLATSPFKSMLSSPKPTNDTLARESDELPSRLIPVIVGNSIPLASEVELWPALFMRDVCRLICLALIGLFRSRASLQAEILTLRHQLNVLRRKSPQRLERFPLDADHRP